MKIEVIYMIIINLVILVKKSVELDLPNTCTENQIYNNFIFNCVQCGTNEILNQASKYI